MRSLNMGYVTEGTILVLIFFGFTIRIDGLDPSLISPCPTGFIYRFQDTGRNTWYGSIFITSDSDSYIIDSIRILLDGEAESLQLYDHKKPTVTVDTLDNTEFLIEGLDVKVRKTNTFSLTIALKYKPGRSIPKVTAYRVNELTVCSQTASHIVSPSVSFTPGTVRPPPPTNNVQSPWTSRPTWIKPQPSPLPTPMDEAACGTRIQGVTPLIVGGVESSRGEWPWHGALFALEGQDSKYRCGSSLVSRRHVVTAAHCVCLHQRSEEPLEASQLFVVFGRMKLSNWGDPDSQSHYAKKIIVHSEYNSSKFRNDIAIIRLAEPVRITEFVRPICLWTSFETLDQNALIKRKGTVVGWGYTETGQISEVLQHAEIPVIDTSTCVNKKPEFYLQYLSASTFCAGQIGDENTKTKQVCNGDSGGGIVFARPGTDVWELRGLVSLAPYDRAANKCDIKLYMVFTDVAYFSNWINQCISRF